MPKINQLKPATSLANTDIMIADTSTGSDTRKIAYSDLRTQVQNESKSVFALKGEVASDDQVADAVGDWLDTHVTPTGSAVAIDDTLKIQGAAADAKAAGEIIVVNGTSGNGTRVNITTTDTDIELAEMSDVAELKSAVQNGEALGRIIYENILMNSFTPGSFNNNGEESSSVTYQRSNDYLPCLPNTTYYHVKTNYPLFAVFYDANKIVIGNLVTINTGILSFETPANTAFVRFAIRNANVGSEVVGRAVVTTFDGYDKIVIDYDGNKMYSELDSRLDVLESEETVIIHDGFTRTEGQYATNSNGYLNYGSLGTYVTYKYNLNGPEKFILSGIVVGLSTALCYICDDSDLILDTIGQGTNTEMSYTDYEISIDNSSASYVVFTFKKSSNPNVAVEMSGCELAVEVNNTVNLLRPLLNKNVYVWGDSRTWYDGKQYGEHTTQEGDICVGFLSWMRQYLGANVLNYGYNGYTSPQIYSVLSQTDESNADAIVLFTGINDWYKNTPLGSLAAIGATFDTTTAYGACQAIVEHILNNYPAKKLYILNPFNGWTANGGSAYTDTDYPKVWKEISDLYSLPFFDLTHRSGFNILNYSIYYVDTPQTFILHLNNLGNEVIGKQISEFMIAS